MTTPLAQRIRSLRLAQGITIVAASRTAQVGSNTWGRWESGQRTPKLWRCGDIARALNVPVAALFTDELVIADVVVSKKTVQAIRAGGRTVCEDVAKRLAGQLEPMIWAAVTAPPVDTRPGTRAKRRRTRAEVLAGVKAANEAKARKASRQAPIQ